MVNSTIYSGNAISGNSKSGTLKKSSLFHQKTLRLMKKACMFLAFLTLNFTVISVVHAGEVVYTASHTSGGNNSWVVFDGINVDCFNLTSIVPSGARNVGVRLEMTGGNYDLLTRFSNTCPDVSNATCKPQLPGTTTESCTNINNCDGNINTTVRVRKVFDGAGTIKLTVYWTDAPSFGNNKWNVLAYDGRNASPNIATIPVKYRGFYTQKLDVSGNYGVNTALSYGINASPQSSTSFNNTNGVGTAWSGISCGNVAATIYTIIHKRRGFPKAKYNIVMEAWDDETYVFINGVEQPFTGNGAFGPVGGTPLTIASCMELNETSTIEIRTGAGGTPNQVRVKITKAVEVNTEPDLVICSGATKQLNATVFPASASYTWSPAAGLSATNVLNPIASPATTTTYTLTAVANSCSATSSVVVNVAPDYAGTIVKVNPTTCGGTDGSISITPTVDDFNGGTYWYRDDFSSATPQTGTKTLSGDAVLDAGSLRLTDAINNSAGQMSISNPGFNAGHIKANFDMYIGSGNGADGITVSYGDLSIWFDSFLNGPESCKPENGQGGATAISVLYNGNQVACLGTQIIRGANQKVQMVINNANQLSLDVGNRSYVVSLSGTAYPTADKSAWQWNFSAKTGNINDQHRIDNLNIIAYNQFQYSIDNLNWQNSSNFTNLPADSYSVYMRSKTEQVCSNSNTIATVILDEIVVPSATITSANTTICHGNEVTLSGNVLAQGAWTMEIGTTTTPPTSPGTILVNGSGNASWTETVSPDITTNYSINSITITGCTGAGSGLTEITLPAQGVILSNDGDQATCVVKENNFIHFYDRGGLLLSINSHGQDLGAVTVDSYVDGGSNVPACLDPSNPYYITATLGRHWVISPTNLPTNDVTIRLPFDNGEYTTLQGTANFNLNQTDNTTTIADLKLSKYSGANENRNFNDNCGNGTTTLHTQIGNGTVNEPGYIVGFDPNASYTTFDVSTFSEFWLHGATSSPLPVTLTNFSATCENEVTLSWTTASEQNSDRFVVEKSRDGNSWSLVGEQAAAGNSNTILDYNFTDANSWNATFYYRLRQIDFNGAEEIYGPISVSCKGNESSMTVYPNPNNGSFTIEIASTEMYNNAQLFLTDLTGKVIASQTVNVANGTTQILMDHLDLKVGTYLVTLIGADQQLKPVQLVVTK